MEFKYRIFVPGGNTTALVLGIETDINTRKIIQDWILQKHKDVEQVGFVSKDFLKPELMMTGGEFCGNATRCAVHYYLNAMPGDISLKVSGVNKPLSAGITDTFETWTQMPVYESIDKITFVDDGIYYAEIEGISHLVVSQRQSIPFLENIKEKGKVKQMAKWLLERYDFYKGNACGVIFTENVLDIIKIHPCVFVVTAETSYYETACGSGCVAVGLVNAILYGESVCLHLLQPSNHVIKTYVEYIDGIVKAAKISGLVTVGQEFSGGDV